MVMNKVYIVQEPMKRTNNGLQPLMDLTPAANYGDIEILLPPGPVALSPSPMINELKKKLAHFKDEDFLVAVGDPTAIMAASIIAARANNGVINALKWDKQSRSYIKIRLEV